MFVYIAGAGAMGCRFGYQLHKAGNEVIFIGYVERSYSSN